jgi:hypothetical protein
MPSSSWCSFTDGKTEARESKNDRPQAAEVGDHNLSSVQGWEAVLEGPRQRLLQFSVLGTVSMGLEAEEGSGQGRVPRGEGWEQGLRKRACQGQEESWGQQE